MRVLECGKALASTKCKRHDENQYPGIAARPGCLGCRGKMRNSFFHCHWHMIRDQASVAHTHNSDIYLDTPDTLALHRTSHTKCCWS